MVAAREDPFPEPPSTQAPPSLAPSVETREVTDFSAFYRKYLPRLVAFLMVQGVPCWEAGDVAQEAMTKAWESWEVIDHPIAWVRRVACRAWGSRLGSVERPVHPVPEDGVLLTAAQASDVEERHDLVRRLKRLPLRQRQIMAWGLVDYNTDEIAQELGISSEAVRSSRRKARRTLSQDFPPEGEETR